MTIELVADMASAFRVEVGFIAVACEETDDDVCVLFLLRGMDTGVVCGRETFLLVNGGDRYRGWLVSELWGSDDGRHGGWGCS
jgi:hypothetical protein